MKRRFLRGLLPLFLCLLACQPVIAVGWNEFLFVFLLVALLLGPPIYGFIRRVERRFRQHEKEKTKRSE